jgi:hypothetical protein
MHFGGGQRQKRKVSFSIKMIMQTTVIKATQWNLQGQFLHISNTDNFQKYERNKKTYF